MADVSERGQLFLIGALSLAVVFLLLAVVLNSAIYTENLATRGSNYVGDDDALRFQSDVHRMGDGLIDHVNDHNEGQDYPTLESKFVTGVESFSTAATRYGARTGEIADVTVDGSSWIEGTRIVQAAGTDRTFVDAGSTTDWTLVTSVPADRGMRNATLRVAPDSSVLAAAPNDDPADYVSSNAFRVRFAESGGPVYAVFVYWSSSNDVAVRVVEDADSDSRTFYGSTCHASGGGHETIDLTGGTVGGDRCAALDFVGTLANDYDIQYRNGNHASGTYDITVRKQRSDVQSAAYSSDTTASPYTAEAIYAAKLKLRYETNRLHYETTVRIAPGETDV